MPDENPSPHGLLTEAEAETLTDIEAPESERNAIRNRVRERLSQILLDMSALYPTLRDEDIEAIFYPDDEMDLSAIRAATQDTLGLLVLGMLMNDDLLETRLKDAIHHATVACGEEAAVEIAVRRGPLPTVAEWATHLDFDESHDPLTLYNHYLWQSDADPEEVAAVGDSVPLEPVASTPEAVREERAEMPQVQRLPQTAITGIEIKSSDPAETNEGHPADDSCDNP